MLVFTVNPATNCPTVTVQVSVSVKPPESVTVKVQVYTVEAETLGALKVGVAVFALLRLAPLPVVIAQEKLTVSFAFPLKATVPPETTFLSAPAFAIGAVFPVTVSLKVSFCGTTL